jgi:hypothetical protein
VAKRTVIVSAPSARGVAVDDPYADSQKQQLIAEMMRQRAIQPLDQHYESSEQNLARGLTQLGQAWLARKMGQQANAATGLADRMGRAGVDTGIERLSGATQIEDVDGGAPTPLLGGANNPALADAVRQRLATSGQQSQDLHAALDPIPARQGQQVVAQALLARAMPKAVDPMQAATLQLQRDTMQGNQEERKAAREQRMEELKLRIEDARQRGQDSADLRRELAQMQSDTQRQIAEMNDATRRAEIDRKIEADRAKAPATTSSESAAGFLANAGYDPVTKEDDITKLLATATGGLLERGRDAALRAANKTTEGASASQALKSRASEAVLGFLGGKLGAGVSNADRDFMMQRAGDIGNEKLSTGERLAAWKDVRSRMERQAGAVPINPTSPPATTDIAAAAAAELARRSGGSK